jgi:hypothetical protein
MLKQEPNYAMVHHFADLVINQYQLDKNPRILKSFLLGVDAIKGYMNDGLESQFLNEVFRDIVQLKECAPAQEQLTQLKELLENN